MTNFIFKSYIPKNDIKIRPDLLVEKIYKLFDMEIENNSFDDKESKKKLKIIEYLYKEMKKLLVNYHFWYNVSSYNFCCYQYSYTKDNKDEDVGKICGRRINKKNSYDDNSNIYLCAEHDRNHRKYHSKPIKIKENEIICNHINKDGNHCRYSSKINGLCTKHYKYIYKINKEEIYNKIIFYKNYTNIDKEIGILYNIDIFVKEKEKDSSVELLEFAPNKLNNSNTPAININFTKKAKNANIAKKSITNKILQKLYDNNIKNEDIPSRIITLNNRLENLNEKILFNTKIINNIKNNYNNNYVKIEQRKCEQKNCTNCKYYNIVYNSYCSEHISNRIKPPIPTDPDTSEEVNEYNTRIHNNNRSFINIPEPIV
jgi:hypothetical protein